MFTRTLLSAILFCAVFCATAQPFVSLTSGNANYTHRSDVLAQRFRAIRLGSQSGGEELYIGTPSLGVPANRRGANYTYRSSLSFIINYNVENNTFSNTTMISNGGGWPTIISRSISNIRQFVGVANQYDLDRMNYMEMAIRISNTGSLNGTVAVSGLTLNGHSIPGTYASLHNGLVQWHMVNSLFRSSFTLTGTFTFQGSFGTGDENNKVDFNFGHVEFATTALPVTWQYVTAENINNKYKNISWATAQESNTAFFEVQGSADGVRYTTLAKVAAAGNSSTSRQYNYKDITSNSSYYRIAQYDIDGRKSYSKIVRCDAERKAVMLLNHTKQVELVFASNTPRELTLLNMQGVIMRKIKDSNTRCVLSTGNLPVGAYIIVVQESKGSTSVYRFKKQQV